MSFFRDKAYFLAYYPSNYNTFAVSTKALSQLEKQHKKAQETLDDLDKQLEELTKEMEEVR